MWQSTTSQHTKNAAMTVPDDNVRICTYARSATDEHQLRSLEAQVASASAFINTQPDWHPIPPSDVTSTIRREAENLTNDQTA